MKENDCLSHSYHLQIVPQLGVGRGVHLPSPCWDFVCLDLYRSLAVTTIEFVCGIAWLCPIQLSCSHSRLLELTVSLLLFCNDS